MIEDWQSLVKLGFIQNIIGAVVVVFFAYFGFLKNLINPRSHEKGTIGGEVTYQAEHGQSSLSGSQRFVQNLAIILIPSIVIGYVFTILTKSSEKQKYTVTVCGTITDESGNGIEGATFHLLGFDKDTTDKKGYFSLKVEIYQKDTIFQYKIGTKEYQTGYGEYHTSIYSGCNFSKELTKK